MSKRQIENQLILGDNLEVLDKLYQDYGEFVDLIYIDPPFFSNRNYEIIWGDEGEKRSFGDRFRGGTQARDNYILWLKRRVEKLYKVLKQTGTMYLHCDWHADAYIRVFIMDRIFGKENFRNDIAWCYGGGGVPRKDFARKHDSIFRYTKSDDYCFNVEYKKYSEGTLKAPRHSTTSGGAELDLEKGTPITDHWSDLPNLTSYSKEWIGYPTQKPRSLLERIIKVSSNEGDIVLDAFSGGGTTCAVADELNRKFIGIDQSPIAIKVGEARIQRDRNLFSNTAQNPFSVMIKKYSYERLKKQDPYEFERFIVEQFGGEPNTKQRGDNGIDGKKDGIGIQVKMSKVGRPIVQQFAGALSDFYTPYEFEQKIKNHETIGYIISFEFSQDAYGEVAKIENEGKGIIKLVPVSEIIPIEHEPKLDLSFNTIGKVQDKDKKTKWKVEIVAKINDKELENLNDENIDNIVMWDLKFNEKQGFQPQIIMDKKGKQEVILEEGANFIACKATDKNGLENIVVIKLWSNGAVKKVLFD